MPRWHSFQNVPLRHLLDGDCVGDCFGIVDSQTHSLSGPHCICLRTILLRIADSLGSAGLSFVPSEKPSSSSRVQHNRSCLITLSALLHLFTCFPQSSRDAQKV